MENDERRSAPSRGEWLPSNKPQFSTYPPEPAATASAPAPPSSAPARPISPASTAGTPRRQTFSTLFAAVLAASLVGGTAGSVATAIALGRGGLGANVPVVSAAPSAAVANTVLPDNTLKSVYR